MTSDGHRLFQDLRRSLLDPPTELRPRTVTTTQAARLPTAQKLSVPTPNITMKPEPHPSLLHRIPDTTAARTTARTAQDDERVIRRIMSPARLRLMCDHHQVELGRHLT